MNKIFVYAIIVGAVGFAYTQYKPQIHDALGLPAVTSANSHAGIDYQKLGNLNTLNTGVHLMSASWCGYCTKLRETMRANNIPFTEYNTEDDANVDAFYQKNNLDSGVPVTVIGGDVVYGYDVERLEQAFQRSGINISGL